MIDMSDVPALNFDPNGELDDHQLHVQIAILKTLRLVLEELRRPRLEADPDRSATDAIAAAIVSSLAAELAHAAEMLGKAADTLKYAGKGPESVAVWTAAQRAARAAAGAMPGAASDGSQR